MTKRHAAKIYLNDKVLNYESENCLIWPFSRDGNGYGRIFDSKTKQNASVHAIVCKIKYGPKPVNKTEVAHTCGNGKLGCVNPIHLKWATHKENMDDKVIHNTTNRGERQGKSKLTENDVIEILKSTITYKQLSKKYNVHEGTISLIKRGLSWSWLSQKHRGIL